MGRNLCLWMTFVLLTVSGVSAGENLALGKKYTLSPAPNYEHCTDDGDSTQLTDGKTTDQYLWTQPGCVGWSYASTADITIDLERVEPIDAISFHSAAGAASVAWPSVALALVSEDGKTWYSLGDLMTITAKRDGAFDSLHYHLRKIGADSLATKGRYVKLFIRSTGPYIFLDEIEISRGDDALVTRPYSGEPIDSIEKLAATMQMSRVRQRYYQDIDALSALIDVEGEKIDDSARKAELAALRDEIAATEPDERFCDSLDPDRFRTRFPYDAVHTGIFARQARFWRLMDPEVAPLVVRPTEPYAFVRPIQTIPDSPSEAQTLTMAQNEIREAVYTLYNTTDRPLNVTISLGGSFAQAPAGALTCFEIPWTDTSSMQPVAAALIPAKSAGENRWSVALSPGLSTQVWFDVRSNGLPAGTYDGTIRFEAESLAPVDVSGTLRILPVTFPDEQTLILGGWDYADGGGAYNVNAVNLDSFLATMKAYRVNGPWGRPPLVYSGVECKKTDSGAFDVSFDTRPMDEWLALWPDAKEYFIFLSAPNSFAGFAVDADGFNAAVAAWSKAWGAYFESKGIDPSRVSLLVRDEPGLSSEKDHRALIAWAKAINVGEPRFRVWEDPLYAPDEMPEDLIDATETFCPNRPQWLQNREPFDKFYRQMTERGKRLDLYSCSGPVRLLDPYSYFRLQAWQLFAMKGEASFFWAMGDGAGVNCWNEYLLSRSAYSPMFIDPNDPTVYPAKQLAAMRESVFDFELLNAYAEFLAKERAAGGDTARFERLLTDGLEEVLWSQGATRIDWGQEKDRTKADRLRVKLLEVLAEGGE